MSLFIQNTNQNLLPKGGEVFYFGKIFDEHQSQNYLHKLLENINWEQDNAVIFGKQIVVNRKVAWYGNGGQNYTYSGTTKVATKWTKELLEIKKVIQNYTKVEFNSCLLNLYENGNQGMGLHSDSEKELGKNTTIASVSFGTNREFRFRHKKDKNLKTSVVLESGSLLIMKGETQQNWLHQIPKSGKVLEPRVNLTFRTISEI